MKHIVTGRLAATALCLGALAGPALAQDWKEQMPVFRVGLMGGENEADRLKETACFKDMLEEALGVPVELYPASDYAGVMQGLLAGQLEYAGLGASAYAGIHLQNPDAVEPFAVAAEADGSTGYYSVMYTLADSGIGSIEDMKGKSLAFADPNSTSGYLVPKAEMEAAGIVPEEYFGSVGFGGGHEQAVIAVLEGQYDAGVTWVSGIGERSEGYTRGNLRSMVDKGMVDMEKLDIIWQSNLIPNGPRVYRQDLPQEVKDILVDLHLTMAETDPECFKNISEGEGGTFVPTDHTFFEGVVDMRRQELEAAR